MSFLIDPDKDTVSNNPTLIDIITNDTIISNNGDITIGNNTGEVRLNGGICYNILRLTDAGTNYDIQDTDYIIEVVSSTYNTITLPPASNSSGCSFIVSRETSNTNKNLLLIPQAGDDIDTYSEHQFRRPGHIKVVSNGVNSWYVV